ncbi:MAG: recombinase family protein [Roseiarcus sp.]
MDAGEQFRSPGEAWADTSTSTGRLMIAVLGGLADVERDLIRTRTAEGRTRAKARAAHRAPPEAHARAAARSTASACRRCDSRGTGQELQRGAGDNFEAGRRDRRAARNTTLCCNFER